jgi:hypothetical protein
MLFKKCMAGFVTYFTQHDHLNERDLPANMSFNDCCDRLTLCSSHVMWLLNARQIIRLKNIQVAHDFERESSAVDFLWKAPSGPTTPTGMFDEDAIVSDLCCDRCPTDGSVTFD